MCNGGEAYRSIAFWLLFPLSWTGVKTVVLFLFTALPVLVLRIAQLHGLCFQVDAWDYEVLTGDSG